MGNNSKEKYFHIFLEYLNNTKKESITLSLDKVREILGVDEKGDPILCRTPNKNREFWSYNKQHRFPFYLGNNGWKCSSHYTGDVKEITFIKDETIRNKKIKTNSPFKNNIRMPINFDVEIFIQNGLGFDTSFIKNNDPNSPNYHVIPGHEREKSWDYCYEVFKTINEQNPDIDYLCLHLAFYLASWGMYRGSTFLFRNDYKVHKEVVEEIIKYKELRGQIPTEENVDSITELIDFIKTAYGERNHPTKTLITKIILGTLACVPAYDTYVVRTMKKYKLVSEPTRNSLLSLGKLYQDNEQLINAKNKKYPPMKFLDMAFFKESYDGKKDDEDSDE